MFCAISGEVPQDPVVSKTSGHLFEKRLIEKYLKETGKCPVTGKDLSEDDLIPLQANKAVRPRQVTATSIPGLLAMFQNEWDEVMIETFTLKQHLDTTRQELSQALYQHDAACRVIARLMRERDEARAALSGLQHFVQHTSNTAQSNGHTAPVPPPASTSMDVEGASNEKEGIPASVISRVNEKCAELSASRKAKKPAPEGPYSRESIASSTSQLVSFTPHSASKGAIHSVAVSSDGNQILTGGVDKEVLLSDRKTGQVVGRLSGHSKKVNAVAFHPGGSDLKFSASADATIKVWRPSGDASGPVTFYEEAKSMTGHGSDVTAISVHPTGDYLASFSLDKSWSFWDIASGTRMCSAKSSEAFKCGNFHPDGLIIGTGAESGSVKIWDVREQSNVASFDDHGGEINGISFSENGFYLASAGSDDKVRVWDLRKLKCAKTLDFGGAVSALSFDASGLYLSVANGNADSQFGVTTYFVKDWSPVSELSAVHTKAISGIVWGASDSFLCTASQDRVVRVFGH